jgi:hypothetical protein
MDVVAVKGNAAYDIDHAAQPAFVIEVFLPIVPDHLRQAEAVSLESLS